MPLSEKLNYIFEFRKRIKDIHPLLDKCFPIVVSSYDKLDIYDIADEERYTLVKTEKNEFGHIPKIRASFPLESYGKRPVCIITEDVFDEPNGYAVVFHEFIHCQQYEICENRLKQRLSVYKQALLEKNYMWELNYNFPYNSEEFISYCNTENNLLQFLTEKRKLIKDSLGSANYEYMTWQEWKEGFARYIETMIIEKTGNKVEQSDSLCMSRVSLYKTGARLIGALKTRHSGCDENIENLFELIYANID